MDCRSLKNFNPLTVYNLHFSHFAQECRQKMVVDLQSLNLHNLQFSHFAQECWQKTVVDLIYTIYNFRISLRSVGKKRLQICNPQIYTIYNLRILLRSVGKKRLQIRSAESTVAHFAQECWQKTIVDRWHTLRKPFAMLDATLWGLALRLIALMRARYSGKAQNNVQNETSRVCVLGGT